MTTTDTDDLTQTERILLSLRGSSRGYTANELYEKLGIAQNVLGTLLWELKRDGYIARVGGKRGSWRYGLTSKGQAALEPEADPLERLTKVISTDSGGFDDMLQVINSMADYKLLRRYIGWMKSTYPELLNPELPNVDSLLEESVLGYLGVDVKAFRQQRKSLEALLTVL